MPWLILLAAVTGVFIATRGYLDNVYPAFGYLLIVLGASSRAGRRWGLGIAVLAFLCFNFFLLPPYYTLTLRDPLDWVVLGTFLVTGAVAAHLFEVARRETREARLRAEEIERFSAVGAEALAAGRAEEGVGALARLLLQATGVQQCEVYLFQPEGEEVRLVACVPPAQGAPPQSEGPDLLHYVVRYRGLALQRPEGDVHVEAGDAGLARLLAELPASEATLIPLVVRERVTGLLRLVGRGRLLSPAEIRFVEALAYYTALGVERVRLVGEEERAAVLREGNRLKDAMLAAVSHDLRTPLTTIKAVAQELRSREEGAAIIEAEADRLNRFVADLLDLSRLESGSLPLRPELVPADDLVGAALQQVSPHFAEREFQTSLPEDVPFGRFDFVLALRSLVNLLENACKYAPSGAVEIGVSSEGGELLLTVSDRGPGVPEPERSQLFAPFHRGRDVPDARGTGLGLSIARRLARAQGGDLRYEPRPGGGSSFTLALPAADAPLPAERLA